MVKKSDFTLIEIVVSMAILSLSLAGLLQLLTSSQNRVAQSVEKWHSVHMAAQAAEYLLLHRSEEPNLPDDFFPYPGYRADFSYEDVEELPEEFAEYEETLPLKCLTIQVVRELDQKVLETVHVDRISYEDMQNADATSSN